MALTTLAMNVRVCVYACASRVHIYMHTYMYICVEVNRAPQLTQRELVFHIFPVETPLVVLNLELTRFALTGLAGF